MVYRKKTAFLALALWLHCPPAFAFFDEIAQSPFIEKHWWQVIVLYFLGAAFFSFKSEERTLGAIFFFLLTLGFLAFCYYN